MPRVVYVVYGRPLHIYTHTSEFFFLSLSLYTPLFGVYTPFAMKGTLDKVFSRDIDRMHVRARAVSGIDGPLKCALNN